MSSPHEFKIQSFAFWKTKPERIKEMTEAYELLVNNEKLKIELLDKLLCFVAAETAAQEHAKQDWHPRSPPEQP